MAVNRVVKQSASDENDMVIRYSTTHTLPVYAHAQQPSEKTKQTIRPHLLVAATFVRLYGFPAAFAPGRLPGHIERLCGCT